WRGTRGRAGGEAAAWGGLEEGEVEGETLLMVESEDQASVDLSHDQSGESLTSDLGEEPEGWAAEDMAFHCERCHKWVPTAQLRGQQPSYLKGDNFFKFCCAGCSEDGNESFERMRLTWQQVVMLAMYNLSLEGTGRQGYFRWKEDICAFIGRHWSFLLGTRKKTSTWWSTVAGCLSVGSPSFFRSGAQEFGEPGWWRLVQNRPPTLRPDQERAPPRSRGNAHRPAPPPPEPGGAPEGPRRRGGARHPVESAMQLKEKRSRTQEAKDIRRAQREGAAKLAAKLAAAKLAAAKLAAGGRRPEPPLERGEVVDFSSLSSSDRTPLTSPSPSPSPDFSAPGTPASHSATPSLLSEADLIPDAMPPQALFHDDEELEPEGMIDPGMEEVPPAGRPRPRPPPATIKREPDSEGDSSREREEPLAAGQHAGGARRRLGALGLLEERRLLRRLDACPLALAVAPHARRLRRKLVVRQAQRHRGLALLDLDRAVSAALSLVGGVYGARGAEPQPPGAAQGKFCTSSPERRILDRFQTSTASRRGVQQNPLTFWHRLMGAEGSSDRTIKSPYTARILKPYIRRDYESRPLKLRLLAEIRGYSHRGAPGWSPPPDAPIDYCYVRPSHIPPVNALCSSAFWPGVDLSECLQYPDFSVVALYKKVVVGFGFMVPDVKYNEAYISFLLVHPEWRRAGIGTFMIYHLIQTCMGKDVTLHVSVSNPAMLLYQKFGFKVEEYILDFYDQYYPPDSTECRHAFFLRLRR
ncbi:cysteine-rich protein 2-binding protein, partial [Menidia menidia]